MSKEILMVVDAISNEKGVPRDVIFEAVEAALASASRKRFDGEEVSVRVAIDRATGDYDTFRRWVVIEDDEFENPDAEIKQSYAERRDPPLTVGDVVEERITVENLSRIAKPILEIEDLSDLPGYTDGMALSFSGNGIRSWRSIAPARKRGVYTMGPVRVSNTDPFGLFKRDRLFGDTQTLVVYPRIHDMPDFTIPAAHQSGESLARRRSHDLTPHAASVRARVRGSKDSFGLPSSESLVKNPVS